MQNKAPLIDAAKLYFFFEKQNSYTYLPKVLLSVAIFLFRSHAVIPRNEESTNVPLNYKSFTNVQDNNRKQKVFPLQSGLAGKSILPTLRSSRNSYFPSQLYFFKINYRKDYLRHAKNAKWYETNPNSSYL